MATSRFDRKTNAYYATKRAEAIVARLRRRINKTSDSIVGCIDESITELRELRDFVAERE